VATVRGMLAGGEDASDGETAPTGAAQRRASHVHASPVGAGRAHNAPTSRAGKFHTRTGVVDAWVGPGRVVRGAGVHGEVVDRGALRGRAVRVEDIRRGESRAPVVREGERHGWVVRQWEVRGPAVPRVGQQARHPGPLFRCSTDARRAHARLQTGQRLAPPPFVVNSGPCGLCRAGDAQPGSR